VNISAGQSASLKVSFVGQGPYLFSYNDGTSIRSVSTTSNPHTLSVTPDQNRRYTLSSAGNTACGTTSSDLVGNVRVVIDPTASVALPTPTNLNVCAGSTISIPYTTVGTWAGPRSLIVRLINEADGSSLTSFSGQSESPLQITVPSWLIVNQQFRASVLPVMPASIAGPVISSYIFTVTSVGCLSKPIVTVSPANPSCGSVSLFSDNPTNNSAATYQWVRDGQLIAGATSSSFTATQAGNYYVRVTHTSTNYRDSSAVLPVNILGASVSITSPNTVICGTNTSSVLTATPSIAGGTYQWFRNDILLTGATAATYTATSTGTYRVEFSRV
jgi:large repetitive protein